MLTNLNNSSITPEEIEAFKIKVGRNPDLKKVYRAYLKLQKKLLVKMSKLNQKEEKKDCQRKIEEITFLLKELTEMIIADHNQRYYKKKKAWLESNLSEEELLKIYHQKKLGEKETKKNKEPIRKRKKGKINRRG